MISSFLAEPESDESTCVLDSTNFSNVSSTTAVSSSLTVCWFWSIGNLMDELGPSICSLASLISSWTWAKGAKLAAASFRFNCK